MGRTRRIGNLASGSLVFLLLLGNLAPLAAAVPPPAQLSPVNDVDFFVRTATRDVTGLFTEIQGRVSALQGTGPSADLSIVDAPTAGSRRGSVSCGFVADAVADLCDASAARAPLLIASPDGWLGQVDVSDADTPLPGDDRASFSSNAEAISASPPATAATAPSRGTPTFDGPYDFVRSEAPVIPAVPAASATPPTPAGLTSPPPRSPSLDVPAVPAASTDDALRHVGSEAPCTACRPVLAMAPDALPDLQARESLRRVEVSARDPALTATAAAPRPAAKPGSASGVGASDHLRSEEQLVSLGTTEEPRSLPPNPLTDASDAASGRGTVTTTRGPLALDDSRLGLAALAAAGLGLLLLGLPLYRRIAQTKVLDNDVRRNLLAHVQAHPGLHTSALARAVGIGPTLAEYHLRMLAEFGLVEVRGHRGRRCVFAAGQVSRGEKDLVLAERGRGADLLDAIAAQPGIAQRDLARTLDLADSSVKWHLDRLEEAGVVCVERGPEGKRVRLTERAVEARAQRTNLVPPSNATPVETTIDVELVTLPAVAEAANA